MGQTGRCLNDRLREHNLSLTSTVGGHLSVHCKRCTCSPSFDKTSIIGWYKEKQTREVLEAYTIMGLGDNCVSQPSVALSEKEVAFLRSFGRD